MKERDQARQYLLDRIEDLFAKSLFWEDLEEVEKTWGVEDWIYYIISNLEC
jgi:hypothetical protein